MYIYIIMHSENKKPLLKVNEAYLRVNNKHIKVDIYTNSQ